MSLIEAPLRASTAIAAAATIVAGGVVALQIGSTSITSDKAAQLSVVAASAAESALLDDGGAPAAGYIYRLTGTNNVVTKAQGDTAVHAAGLAGIGNGTLGVAPLTLPTTIIMDGACTPGLPVYLSAATAGIGTHTASALGLVPLFNAKRNVSLLTDASPNYLCEVVPFAPLVAPDDLYTLLQQETATDLGVLPQQLHSYFNDFTGLKSETTLAVRADGWRASNATQSGMETGIAKFYSAGGAGGFRSSADAITPPLTVCGAAWRISASIAATGASGYMYIGLQGDAHQIAMGYFPGESTDYLSFGKGGAASLYSGSAAPNSVTHVAAKDTAQHQYDIESDGVDHVRWRFDKGAWSSWIADTTNNVGWSFVGFETFQHDGRADWIYYAEVTR